MILAGHPRPAGAVLAGLIDAAVAFDGRLPELFASIDDDARIVAYPASCRPQAWAATVGPLILWALAPLLPGRPGETVRQLAGIDIDVEAHIDGFVVNGQRIPAFSKSGVVSYGTANSDVAP